MFISNKLQTKDKKIPFQGEYKRPIHKNLAEVKVKHDVKIKKKDPQPPISRRI